MPHFGADGTLTQAEFEQVVRTATKVVAASNSSAASKGLADYVCDGVDDQVEIQAAIDALPVYGGWIQLSEGNFYVSKQAAKTCAIDLAVDTGASWRNITLNGAGLDATKIYLANNQDCNIIEVKSGDNNIGWKTISNLTIEGNKANQASGNGIHWAKVGGGGIFDTRFYNVFVARVKDDGWSLSNMWGCYITNCLAEYCDGRGMYLNGSESYVYGFHSEHNGGDGIELHGQWFLTDCYIDNNGGHALDAVAMIQTTIKGCRFKTKLGIGAGNSPINTNSACTNNTYIGNILDGRGVADYGMYMLSDNQTVIGNQISAINAYSIYFQTGADYNIARGNRVTKAIRNKGIGNVIYDQHSDLFMDVLAVSATHIRSNEDLNEAIPNTFTLDAQPDVPRTLSGHFDTHAQITAYTIVITGVDGKGNTVTETFTEAASPWDFETSNAYATITSIIMTARTGTGAGDTMDIGITDVLGLSNIIYATGDVYKIKKNNANATVAGAQVNITYDTYDMAVIGLGGGDDFTIWHRTNLNTIS